MFSKLRRWLTPMPPECWNGRESVESYAKRLGLKVTKEINLNGEKLNLVLIPAGKFTMGSPAEEDGRFDNEVQHEVTLTEPYYMGKYEVTWRQWGSVMRGPLERLVVFNRGDYPVGGDHPVERVSWYEVQEFLKQSGNGVKLPTEAQWEWACRAGTMTSFYTGDTESDLWRAGWYAMNTGNGFTKSVGLKQANAWGLYDMHGSVWEWCSDWYDSYPEVSIQDPVGADSGSLRVLRGGSWRDDSRNCRSAKRGGSSPDDRYDNVGFRVVISCESQSKS